MQENTLNLSNRSLLIEAGFDRMFTFDNVIDWFEDVHRIKITQQQQELTGMWCSLVYKSEPKPEKDWNWTRKNITQSFQYRYDALNSSITFALNEIKK